MSRKTVLKLNVIEGADLEAADLLTGKSDPYVIISAPGGKKFQTKVISSTLTPKWNEEFEIELESFKKNKIGFEVFDKDLVGKDDKIGMAILGPGLLYGTHEGWIKLQCCKSGALKLRYTWTPPPLTFAVNEICGLGASEKSYFDYSWAVKQSTGEILAYAYSNCGDKGNNLHQTEYTEVLTPKEIEQFQELASLLDTKKDEKVKARTITIGSKTWDVFNVQPHYVYARISKLNEESGVMVYADNGIIVVATHPITESGKVPPHYVKDLFVEWSKRICSGEKNMNLQPVEEHKVVLHKTPEDAIQSDITKASYWY